MKDFLLRNTTKCDLISRKVSLKYNGRFRFKTLLGGIATIIIFILLIVYLILLSVMPIKLVASSAYINEYFSNPTNSSNSDQFTTSGNITWNTQKELSFVNLHSLRLNNSVPLSPYPSWYFGFKLSRDYDPTYVILGLYHAAYDGSGYYYGAISFDKCVNNSAFPKYDNLTTFFCPNASDISMLYAYSNGVHSKIAMNIQKCIGTGCKSDAEIEAWMNYTTIKFFTINSYYDSSDSNNPIKKYINDVADIRIDTGPFLTFLIDQTDVVFQSGSIMNVFETQNVQINSFCINGSSAGVFGLVEFYYSPKYYKIIEGKEYQPALGRNLENYNIYQTNYTESNSNYLRKDIADRNDYYAFFIMAQIGGFYSFLRLVFKIFFGLVSEKMFIIELLNKLRVKMKEIKTHHKIKKANKGRIAPLDTRDFKSENISESEKEKSKSQIINRSNVYQESNTQNENYKMYLRSKKSRYRTRREPFTYNFTDIIYMMF